MTSVQAQFQWAKRVASTVRPDDELAIGMTLDSQGNCNVTGWFDGTNDFGGVTLANKAGCGHFPLPLKPTIRYLLANQKKELAKILFPNEQSLQ